MSAVMQTCSKQATVEAIDRPRLPAGERFHLNAVVAWVAMGAIAAHFVAMLLHATELAMDLPLIAALILGAPPLIVGLLRKLWHAQFGTDLLAAVSVVTAMALQQYLAGTIIVLMLSGGGWLESYAKRTASGALRALTRRMPSIAHRWEDEKLVDAEVSALCAGDVIFIMPHEICPADGVVVEGRGSMDESFLTGEPYGIVKASGSEVLSGALNGASALTVRVLRTPGDSRYARITRVMRDAESRRIKLQRVGDTIAAWFTPLALGIAGGAWLVSGDPLRFLAVVVVATPCPVLLAIPVAIIGSVSLCARRGIIIRDAAILEHLDSCRTLIFDKTGTLTIGRPRLAEVLTLNNADATEALQLAASLEQYSRHPLAPAVLEGAKDRSIQLLAAEDVHEPPGFGLRARIGDHLVVLTGRKHLSPDQLQLLPPEVGGLECIVLVDDILWALLRFRDEPRQEVRRFIDHLAPKHRVRNVILLTGDRAVEAQRIARIAGIGAVLPEKSPEEKVEIVAKETARAPTLFVGDGINDAPALTAATVGISLGGSNDIATDKIDWSRAVVDSASVRAVFGGRRPGPTPWIAGKTARSTTSSRTPMAFLWRRRSRPPTGMM